MEVFKVKPIIQNGPQKNKIDVDWDEDDDWEDVEYEEEEEYFEDNEREDDEEDWRL